MPQHATGKPLEVTTRGIEMQIRQWRDREPSLPGQQCISRGLVFNANAEIAQDRGFESHRRHVDRRRLCVAGGGPEPKQTGKQQSDSSWPEFSEHGERQSNLSSD